VGKSLKVLKASVEGRQKDKRPESQHTKRLTNVQKARKPTAKRSINPTNVLKAGNCAKGQ
jgi:hypothetical protein